MAVGPKSEAPIYVKHKLATPFFFLKPNFSRMSINIPIRQKCFYNVPRHSEKEQFYMLLWKFEFGIKRIVDLLKELSHIMSLS